MQSHCVRKKETACVEQESVVSKVHAWRLKAREGGARVKIRRAKGKFIVRNEIIHSISKGKARLQSQASDV